MTGSVSSFVVLFICGCGITQIGVQAQIIDQVECLNCISQGEGCRYCVVENYDSSAGGSPLYCDCNNDADAAEGGGGGGTCLTTEEQCEIDIGQLVGAVAWLLLLPCLCACACLAGCVYLCCRSGHNGVQNSSASSNYYMQDNVNGMHPVIVGTEPYSNPTYSQPQKQDQHYGSPVKNTTDQPFSQALTS